MLPQLLQLCTKLTLSAVAALQTGGKALHAVRHDGVLLPLLLQRCLQS